MANSLSIYRYFFFILFTLCNAIVCCVSVWNLVLAQQIHWNPPVDISLIAVSAFGILFIFPILFIDLLRKNAIVGRIWFECLWVGTFCILELSNAAAATSILPNMLCNFAADLLIPTSCASTKALISFAWLGVINLLGYLSLLVVSTILHLRDDPQVWRASTRTYPWFAIRESLSSAPPSLLKTWHKPMASAAPQLPKPSDFSKRLVANSQYDLEKQQSARTEAPSSRIPAHLTEPSPRVSVIITPSSQSPVSDEFSYESSSSSDYTTSMLSGLPGSSLYVPYPLSTPRRSALMSAVMQSTPARSASHNRVPSSAMLPSKTPTSTRAAVHPPRSVVVPRTNTVPSGPRQGSRRTSKRPPPLDMVRLNAYGR